MRFTKLYMPVSCFTPKLPLADRAFRQFLLHWPNKQRHFRIFLHIGDTRRVIVNPWLLIQLRGWILIQSLFDLHSASLRRPSLLFLLPIEAVVWSHRLGPLRILGFVNSGLYIDALKVTVDLIICGRRRRDSFRSLYFDSFIPLLNPLVHNQLFYLSFLALLNTKFHIRLLFFHSESSIRNASLKVVNLFNFFLYLLFLSLDFAIRVNSWC